MTVALCVQTIAFTALLAWLLRSQAQTLRDTHAAHAEQLQGLLQRVQAPAEAVHEHALKITGPVEQIQPLTDAESAVAQDANLALEMIANYEGSE